MSLKLFDLRGKIVFITGSGRGLGYVYAQGLGEAGAKVVLNDVDEKVLTTAVDSLREDGIDAYGYTFDITSKKKVVRNIEEIESNVGPISVLINNAGINIRAPIVEMEEATWRNVLDVNLTGPFLVAQAVAQGMIKRKKGKIINICSLLSEVGRPTIPAYTASKGGIKMLTRAMAVEWAQHNIQVNGIGPGYFATEMNTALVENPEFDNWIKNRTPAHRWGKPEELIGAAIFLSSESSNFITGQVIYVDGGILASI